MGRLDKIIVFDVLVIVLLLVVILLLRCGESVGTAHFLETVLGRTQMGESKDVLKKYGLT